MQLFIKQEVMEKKDLLNKLIEYLGDDFDSNNKCCKELIDIWAEAATKFRASNPDECCLSTMRSLLHFFVEESFKNDYIVAKHPMFGDLFEIRTKGFENRYLSNIKLCRTYKAAYEKTELEYKKTFSKRRYSSYDSFRQIRSRKMKKRKIG
jgi:hypothetical protein